MRSSHVSRRDRLLREHLPNQSDGSVSTQNPIRSPTEFSGQQNKRWAKINKFHVAEGKQSWEKIRQKQLSLSVEGYERLGKKIQKKTSLPGHEDGMVEAKVAMVWHTPMILKNGRQQIISVLSRNSIFAEIAENDQNSATAVLGDT